MIHCKNNLIKKYSQDNLPYMAVSGGVDSIAAAHFLRHRIKGIFHVNHNYIDQDTEIKDKVVDFAKFLGLYNSSIFEDYNGIKKFGLGSEGDCRRIRLLAIERHKITLIYGHHLNDCVESYLMNCFNGKNVFNPMPYKTSVGLGSTVIRPFLLTKKQAFIDYVKIYKLSEYVIEDNMNADTTRKRNFIRNKMLPCMKNMFPLETIVKKKILLQYKGIFDDENNPQI